MVKALRFRMACQLLDWQWTLQSMPANFLQWLAHRLPRRLVYFCFVRVWANASFVYHDQEVGTLTPNQMLDAWDKESHV